MHPDLLRERGEALLCVDRAASGSYPLLLAQQADEARLAALVRLTELQEGAVLPSPNKSLQRSARHKVLGRGRPSAERTRALRARVLKCRRAAVELSR